MAKEKTKLSFEDVFKIIKKEKYIILDDERTTICQLTLQNGFTVIGSSLCTDPDNFNKKLGEEMARNMAFTKVCELEAYLLRQRLFERGLA